MNIVDINIDVMWNHIVIILLVTCLVRFIIDIYIIVQFKKIYKNFYLNKWTNLDKKIERIRNICIVFSEGPANKNVRMRYNILCLFLASMFFVKGNNEKFLNNLKQIKKEEEFELKPFILSLYYRSKGDENLAIQYYRKYLKSKHRDSEIGIIMNKLFNNQEILQYDKSYIDAIRSFKNPAIKKLFIDNKIIDE